MKKILKESELRGRGARFFSRSLHSREKSAGFTLIEIILVVALIMVISTVSFVSLSGFRTRKDVELAVNEVSVALRETRQRSVTQEDGKRWGVRFTNSTSTDTYKIFTGASYSTSTVVATHGFNRRVELSEPSEGYTYDFLFAPVSGKVSERKAITLVPTTGGIQQVGTVIVNELGSVTGRVEKNLVGYWHFDEGTSTSTADASGGGNTGTLTNSPTWASASSCRAGQCLDFNGSNYVDFPNDLGYGAQVSVFAWFKSDGTPPGGHHIIFGGQELEISIPTAGELRTGVYTDTRFVSNHGSGLTDADWHYVGFTFDGSIKKSYIDGGYVGEQSITSGSLTHSFSNRRAGRFGSSSTYYLNGLIDEIRIYSRALTADEISAHYNDLR